MKSPMPENEAESIAQIKLCSKYLRLFVFCLDGFHFLLRFLACFLLGNFNFLRALFSFSASLCALLAGGNLPLHFLLRFLLHFLLRFLASFSGSFSVLFPDECLALFFSLMLYSAFQPSVCLVFKATSALWPTVTGGIDSLHRTDCLDGLNADCNFGN